MRVTLSELRGDGDQLREDWLALEKVSSPPFFRSWGWIGSWLDALPLNRKRWLLKAQADGRIVALGVILPGWRRRLLVAPTRVAYLHDSPVAAEQRLAIEFNGLLCDPAIETDPTLRSALWTGVWRALTAKGVEALLLPGVVQGEIPTPPGAIAWSHGAKAAPRVDLLLARERGGGSAGLLGRSGAARLRRALRGYERVGAVAMDRPASLEVALTWLDRLADLHERSWTRRKQAGAFANPFFLQFHRKLLTRLFDTGQIELLRIRAASQEIGYLYNFKHRDAVLAYQSGFAYQEDPRLKPGLISHALAIDAALSDPTLRIYDFLAGDSRFKRGFANSSVDVDWLGLSREYGPTQLDHALRRFAKRCLRRDAAPRSTSA